MIVLQFVGGSGFGAEAIKWFSAGPISHVDAVLPDGSLLGSRSDAIGGVPAGVQIRPTGYEMFKPSILAELPADDEMTALFYNFLKAQLGKPYDGEAIVGFAAGRSWRDTEAWFCSELQGAALERCLWFPWALATPSNRLTPEALLIAVSARCLVTM